MKTLINIPAPQTPRSQLPSQNPHNQATSDQTHFRNINPFFFLTSGSFPSPNKHPLLYYVCERFVALSQRHVAAGQSMLLFHHFNTRFWAAPNSTVGRLQLGMAVDSVHHRFAVASDFEHRTLISGRGLMYQQAQVSWFLSADAVSFFFFCLHRLPHHLPVSIHTFFHPSLTRLSISIEQPAISASKEFLLGTSPLFFANCGPAQSLWVGEWRLVGQGLHHTSFTCTIHPHSTSASFVCTFSFFDDP